MKLQLTTTTYENQVEKQKVVSSVFEADNGEENELVNLYPEMTYQSFEGFGGALTESAGFVYSKMKTEQQKEMLQQYYDKHEMNYRIARLSIDSCDFSLGHYEAVSDAKDELFESFQLDRVKECVFPLLDDAQKMRGEDLELMLTPWSPPAFMKINGERNNGGNLKPEYKETWARYICKYILEVRKLGYKVKRISLQNEPKAKQAWDSCIYDAVQEKEFLAEYMWPAMQQSGLSDVEIFIWDHNKERAFERACTIIDETTDKMVAGIAFHWYSGDHFNALRMIRERFPDKKLILSEACIEYSKFAQDDYLNNAQKYAHDMIGNMNNGMNGFYDWNIVLDQQGGPNHVGNFCDAPFLYDIKEQKLMRRNTAAYLWHFSHFIKEGAVRIETTNYSDVLEVTAWKNQDGSIAVVLLNRSKEAIPANIRIGDTCVRLSVAAESISTGMVTEV